MSISTLKNKPLQYLCIGSIAKHFDKFCASFGSTDSAVPRLHFEFLQRKYSKEVLFKLIETNDLKDEHLELILNKHMKEVDLHDFQQCNLEKVVERLLDIGDTIIKLTLTKDTPPEAIKKLIQHSPLLHTLILAFTICTNDILEDIGKYCPLLKVLDMACCEKISDEGLQKLFSLDANNVTANIALENLNVQDTLVRDNTIAYVLKHMPSIQVIQYHNVPKILYDMHEEDFKQNNFASAKKYNLTELEFHYPFGTSMPASQQNEVLQVCTSTCPCVRSLTIGQLSEEDIKLCCKFPQLENVILVGKEALGDNINKVSINEFLETRGIELRNAELTTFSVSVSVLAKSCPKLRTLTLKDAHFQDVGEWNIAPMNLLENFSLEDAIFMDITTKKSTVSILKSSPNIEILNLQHCTFFDKEVCEAILNCKDSLKEIDLSFTDVELSFLEDILLSCSVLEKIHIQYCGNVTSTEYGALQDMLSVIKNSVTINWSDGDSDYTYSEYDDDFFDEYDVYDDEYGYDIDEYDEYDDEDAADADVLVEFMNDACDM